MAYLTPRPTGRRIRVKCHRPDPEEHETEDEYEDWLEHTGPIEEHIDQDIDNADDDYPTPVERQQEAHE